MEKEEKIAFIKKELESLQYNIKTYNTLQKSSEESAKSWADKKADEEKRIIILEGALKALEF